MLGRRTETPAVANAAAHGISFEISVGDLARKSEARAWRVAFAACALSLLLAGGYYYMLPLKEKVPYVVVADPISGTSAVAALRDDAHFQHLTASESLNRSNVANYVLAREGFDAELMRLRDWRQVHVMSSVAVAASYVQAHAANNPEAPYKTLGSGRAIRVKVLSITPITGAQGQTGATVRFQRTLLEKSSGRTQPMDSRIATIEFVYKANLAIEEADRIRNPLGFQITQYRVDTDFSSTPPSSMDEAADQALVALAAAGVSADRQPVVPPSPIPPPSDLNGVNAP